MLTTNHFSTTNLKTIEDRTCSRCGAQLELVNTMLDSAKGRIIRMFNCQCGKQTWASDSE
jgi:hypothetical protein